MDRRGEQESIDDPADLTSASSHRRESFDDRFRNGRNADRVANP
jgi:hypothetical protein